MTGTVDQEVNTVSGRVGTLPICLGEVGGGRLAFFFVMEDDVSKLIIILSPATLVILV